MKSIGPTTPYGYTIFCDDIRMEIGNKHSFVGIYSSSININKPLPYKFPKFALSIHYVERPGESADPVTLSIYLPGDSDDAPTVKSDVPIEPMRSQETPADIVLDDPVISVAMQIVLAPLEIKSEGLIKVRAYRGDLEIRLGTIRVQAPSAEAQEARANADESTN